MRQAAAQREAQRQEAARQEEAARLEAAQREAERQQAERLAAGQREAARVRADLAEELGDLAHKSLYIKLAKVTPRGLLETARSFVKDAENARSKGKLFMWKLGELKRAKLTRKGS